jgi:hypothetical protein
LPKVTSRSGEIVFTLELSETEMQYLAAALLVVDPTDKSPFTSDPIFDVVTNALDDADLDYSSSWVEKS